MSTTILSDTMVIPTQETQPQTMSATATIMASTATKATAEIESATCECCGLTEECTQAYIERIRERYLGRWICGLCGEAIKDEIVRSKRLISTEEAMAKHMSFFNKFKAAAASPTAAVDPAAHLISAVRQILRRSLDSPRSVPGSPVSKLGGGGARRPPPLARSESCFSTLSG